MKFHQVLAATLCTGSLLTLQGCGGGDSKTTTKPGTKTTPPGAGTTTTTVAGPTTTTTTVPRSPPLTGDAAVEYLNSNYKGWIDGERRSVGVVMRTANKWDDKGSGFFCPGFNAFTGCWEGHAKCITSASILNNHVMLKEGMLEMGLGRGAGMMFNTSLVETKLGRCTYQFDGGTFGRYNRGCGGQAVMGPGTCTFKNNSWFDIDPVTGKETTDTSDVVVKDYCPTRAKAGSAPTQQTDAPCYWKGPAWSKTGKKSESETHKMMSQRIKNQGDHGEPVSLWTEVVIDEYLLLPELHRDPARVVLAMVYDDSGDKSKTGEAKKQAETMAKDMQAEFDMDQPVPVVGVDTKLHVLAQPDVPGPFFYGKRWPTQTTTSTTTLVSLGRCCFDGCSTQNNCAASDNFCGQSKANCASCTAAWCTSQSMAIGSTIDAFLM